jgi:hypothetical protein
LLTLHCLPRPGDVVGLHLPSVMTSSLSASPVQRIKGQPAHGLQNWQRCAPCKPHPGLTRWLKITSEMCNLLCT